MSRRLLTYYQRQRLIIGLTVLLTIFLAIGFGLLINLLAGCTKTAVYVQTAGSEGYVIIRPEPDKYTLPAMQYYFYNHDASIAYRLADSDAQGNFRGLLPEGNYRVLATNTSASGIAFGQMDSHLTATANDNTLRDNSRTVPGSRAVGASLVYSLILNDLNVLADDTVYYSPVPVRLTRIVTVSLALRGDLALQVTGINGSLQGIYPSIYLFTGFTPEADVVRSPDIWMDFTTATSTQHANTWQATLHLFGLCNPNYGSVYRNILKLSLAMPTGEYPFEIDLTGHLSGIMEQTGGLLPSDLPLEITLEWEELEVKSNITPWHRDGDTEIPVPVG